MAVPHARARAHTMILYIRLSVDPLTAVSLHKVTTLLCL